MAARTVLTTAPEDASALAQALAERRLLVVSLCAAWCGTCTEFRAVFERIATTHPEHSFVWLDVEDDANLVDDIDVENFPTLLVYRENDELLHFGVSLPLEGIMIRLLEALTNASPINANSSTLLHLPKLLLRQVNPAV